jgi:hypothetical protein
MAQLLLNYPAAAGGSFEFGRKVQVADTPGPERANALHTGTRGITDVVHISKAFQLLKQSALRQALQLRDCIAQPVGYRISPAMSGSGASTHAWFVPINPHTRPTRECAGSEPAPGPGAFRTLPI